jgi:hypothetical protein
MMSLPPHRVNFGIAPNLDATRAPRLRRR